MNSLTEFLLARIGEEKAIALECGAEQYGWLGYGHQHVLASDEGVAVDPPRFLADCEARRQIVEWHRPSTDHGEGFLPYCLGCWEDAGMDGAPTYPCRTLRYLAAPHADHPDYQEAWRPTTLSDTSA